jgi:Asp-tRNA(Asn)/Glu-tRNA(Gln) amidotransferase A subunit family amidase
MKDGYDLKSVALPYLAGKLLRFFTALLESCLGALITPSLFRSAGITWLRQQTFNEAPTHHPIHFRHDADSSGHSENPIDTAAIYARGFPGGSSGIAGGSAGGGSSSTDCDQGIGQGIHEYARAYRDGSTTPEAVAERLLAAISASDAGDRPLKAFIAVQRDDVLRQARQSTARISAGQPLSILDGVPVAIKDELDMAPYPTTGGTTFLGKHPATTDATVVARLRQAGALLVGKTNMHEIGINVTGLNPHHGTTRNPYHLGHHSGGSSSGSAAAVAAGLVPVAIGADGGGSIRIPAAFCGLVGLKATFGRISEHGALPLDWSIAHIGPLATSASDAALVYAIIAGPDPADPNSRHQPVPTLHGWNDMDLRGLRIGIYRPWFNHANPDVVTACAAMLDGYRQLGCLVEDITIPDLEANRVAHSISITSEMAQAMHATYADHHSEHGLDVRINLALARRFTATDYLLAQRVRTRMISHFAAAFAKVDVIMTPTTAVAAPAIKPAALPEGESDLSTTIEIMRFVTVANMTGLPAISYPAGYTRDGLPIGMQAIGKAWDEATLLRMALAAEGLVKRRSPELYFRIL